MGAGRSRAERTDAGSAYLDASNEAGLLAYNSKSSGLRQPSVVRRDGSPTEEKPKNILWSVCSFILVVEMCERLAFYTFSSTLTLYFIKELGETSKTASQYTSLFNALVYFTPLFGGYMADEVMGRFKTIWVFVLVYITGLAMVTVASYPSILSEPLTLVGLLVFISLGTGGVKANVVTLGGDQFEENDPAQVRQRVTYFNYFYWSTNIGALLANTYLNNLSFNPEVFSGGTISYDMGYFVAYAIPLGVMCVALAVFLAGSSRYKTSDPSEKVLSTFVRCFASTVAASGHQGRLVLAAWAGYLFAAILTIVSYFLSNADVQKWLNVVSLVVIVLSSVCLMILCRNPTWLRSLTSDGFVIDALALNNVHDMTRTFPYFGLLVVFWLSYIQMSTNFELQGCQMYNLIGGIAFSPAFFQAFDTIVILVAIPIIDHWVYPLIERKRGSQLRALSKMWVGFVMVILAMLTAAILEHFRKSAPLAGPSGEVSLCCATGCSFWSNDPSEDCTLPQFCGNASFVAADGISYTNASTCEFNSACVGGAEPVYKPITNFSIWWQILPYMFVGLGEIFTSVSAYEFFYNEVDGSMRSVAQAVNLLTTSFGSFAAGGLNGIFGSWIPENLNAPGAHLDYLFYVIAAINFVALCGFLSIYRGYVYRVDRYDPLNGERYDDDDGGGSGHNKSLHSKREASGSKHSIYSRISSHEALAVGHGVSV